MIGADALAWGDLSRYNTIVLGVRAYERRDDLRANNSRLLEYVQNGGTLIVQYNRAMIDDAYGPYPAQVSNNRITDEHAPVRILDPAHPVFTTPNRITDAAWAGWVQERGLNFLGEKDPRYRDLVQLDRSVSEQSRGRSAARSSRREYGKGRWIYVALGLWRELPAGVDGAYPILANLISLGQPPPAPPRPPAPAGRPHRPPARWRRSDNSPGPAPSMRGRRPYRSRSADCASNAPLWRVPPADDNLHLMSRISRTCRHDDHDQADEVQALPEQLLDMFYWLKLIRSFDNGSASW